MRKILFRGKRVDGKGWVEGLLTIMWGQYHIVNLSDENIAYPIETETVCQYTGLTDKNGRKIFERDIVKVVDKIRENEVFGIGDISFGDGSWKLCGEILYWLEDIISFEFEVIGNIFDNPNLLKE